MRIKRIGLVLHSVLTRPPSVDDVIVNITPHRRHDVIMGTNKAHIVRRRRSVVDEISSSIIFDVNKSALPICSGYVMVRGGSVGADGGGVGGRRDVGAGVGSRVRAPGRAWAAQDVGFLVVVERGVVVVIVVSRC